MGFRPWRRHRMEERTSDEWRRTEEHISILSACYHYDNVNTPYRSSRSTTSHATIFSSVHPYLYSVRYNQDCLCRSPEPARVAGKTALPQEETWSRTRLIWEGPPADEQRRRRWDREGEEAKRRRGTDRTNQNLIFTLALRTVQWRELVALS